MKTKPSLLLLPLLIIVLATGCSPRYYIPNTQNVPGIHSKGQTNLTLAGNSTQAEFQGAYGITNGLAIQVNGGLVFPQEDDNGNRGSGNLIEAGPGYFYNISDSWLFDTYGLFGVGSMKNDFPSTLEAYPNTSGKISATLLRYGFQPGISFHKKYFSITGSARVMGLNYQDVSGNLIFNGVDQQQYLNDNRNSLLLEPALTLRGGLEKFKIQVQLMKSFNLTAPSFRQNTTLITLGLNFNFGGEKVE